MLLEWVNPVYLDISYQEQIQQNFEESSEIQLKDFLKVPFDTFSVQTCMNPRFQRLLWVDRRRSSER